MWRLLEAEQKTGIKLSDSLAMLPAARFYTFYTFTFYLLYCTLLVTLYLSFQFYTFYFILLGNVARSEVFIPVLLLLFTCYTVLF